MNSRQKYRPYIQKAIKDAVWAAPKPNEKGQLVDAKTGKVIEGAYHMGHKYGQEYWRLREAAIEAGKTCEGI